MRQIPRSDIFDVFRTTQFLFELRYFQQILVLENVLYDYLINALYDTGSRGVLKTLQYI